MKSSPSCSGPPRFTVVIPAWNAGRYIGATLLSLAKQEFPSLEVIVMDGGSTDDTLRIAETFPGLAVTVVSEPDRGQLDALQKGLKLARGEIVHWLNADDIMMPGTLAEVDAAFRADAALQLVFSDDFAFEEERRVLVNGGLIKGLSFKDHLLFYRQMYSECIFWRRECTRLLPESDYDLRITTDYAFFLNLRHGLKERWLPKRLGAFRMAEGQMSERALALLPGEQARVKAAAHARLGWSAGSIAWRRALHAPSFVLRQKLRPAAWAALRALRRKLDGGARRAAMTAAFYDDWLDPARPVTPDLIQRLYR